MDQHIVEPISNIPAGKLAVTDKHEIQIKLQHGTLKIAELDTNTIKFSPHILIIGKRESGKSCLIKYLMQHFDKTVQNCVIISPTDRMKQFYSQFVAGPILYQYDKKIISDIFARQKRDGKDATNLLVVFDDCIGTNMFNAKNMDQELKELFFNARQYNITLILTMQFPLGLTPELRTNFDYVFLFADDFASNVHRLYDHYAGLFPQFNMFKQIFDQLTCNYGAMCLIRDKQSIDEKVKYVKHSNEPIQMLAITALDFVANIDAKKSLHDIEQNILTELPTATDFVVDESECALTNKLIESKIYITENDTRVDNRQELIKLLSKIVNMNEKITCIAENMLKNI